MTPEAIARAAWEHKDERAPMDTILDRLGLDRIPRGYVDGWAAVNRYSACLNAWRDLIQTEHDGDYTKALPDNGYRRGRYTAVEKVPWSCAHEDCDYEDMRTPGQARLRDYCSPECASAARRGRSIGGPGVDEDLIERNRRVVQLYRTGDYTQAEIAEKIGRTKGLVNNVLKHWRQGTGWAQDTDQREAA